MKSLQKGDIVGIVSPAGFVKEGEDLHAAINLLENWNLKVKLGKHVFSKHKHFAGTDAERTADFQAMLDDDNIKAIWCTRGGYGSVRLLSKLDFTNYNNNPKWIIGFSDITVFHHVANYFKVESLHAIMPISTIAIAKEDSVKQSLYNALFGKKLRYSFKSNTYNRVGEATGEVIGGNLSLMASMLGSKYTYQTENKILFIEDVGEYKYSIDRMLQSLKLNGYFDNCNGLIVGNFTNIKKNDPPFEMTLEELILDVVKEYDFPVCFDFEAGHTRRNHTLIFGRKSVLKVKKDRVVLKFMS